ncbi:MAG: GtrA family protein [Propionibacteriaceae bacterium]
MHMVAPASGAPEPQVAVIAPFTPHTAAHVEEQATCAVSAGFLPILVAQGTTCDDVTAQGITHIGSPAGRGAAIRAGMEHLAPGLPCIVVDSAWSVTSTDLDMIRQLLCSKGKDHLVLAQWSNRQHSLLARLHTVFLALILKLLCGVKHGASLTGVWGIAEDLVPAVSAITGTGYEQETKMLIQLSHQGHHIDDVILSAPTPPRAPDFRLWRDGITCYIVIIVQFFTFMMSSVVSMTIDLSLYALVIHTYWQGSPMPKAVISSTIIARIISSLFNYTVNRNIVFSKEGGKRSIVRYYLLAAAIMMVSALGSSLLAPLMPKLLIVAKFLVDLLLFFVSYLTQKHWVFRDRENSI